MVKRLAKAVYIRLRASVIRHTGNAVFRTHCPHEDQAAPPTLGEFRAEMVGDVQMRHRIEPQSRLKQLPIKLQELAGISGAGIGDDKADVEIVSSGGESPDEILPRDIKHDDSMLHTVTLAKFNAYFLKQVLPPRSRANSLPIPDEAPVTSAQGPNLFLSSATLIFLFLLPA